jgi:hypothetical protein
LLRDDEVHIEMKPRQVVAEQNRSALPKSPQIELWSRTLVEPPDIADRDRGKCAVAVNHHRLRPREDLTRMNLLVETFTVTAVHKRFGRH